MQVLVSLIRGQYNVALHGYPFDECPSDVPVESIEEIADAEWRMKEEPRVRVRCARLRGLFPWAFAALSRARVRKDCRNMRGVPSGVHWGIIQFSVLVIVLSMLFSALQVLSDISRQLTKFRGDIIELQERVRMLGEYRDVGEPETKAMPEVPKK